MYLCPPDPKSLGVIAAYSSATEPQQDAALDLLEEHASHIDTARVFLLAQQQVALFLDFGFLPLICHTFWAHC